MLDQITFSVFTKPWPNLTIPELAALVKDLGYDHIEFPVRPGFQLDPDNVEKGLPKLVQQLKDHGITIASIAGPTTEAAFAGCAEAGIPIIRVIFGVGKDGYVASEKRAKEQLASWVPLCEKYGVKVGVQNHFGRTVPPNSLGLRALLSDFDPRHIGAIWDSAHNALCGEDTDMGLDVVWPHLCMVNLKNAMRTRVTGPEAQDVDWTEYFTSGRQGFASWPRVVDVLNQRQYRGVVCLTAEYSDVPSTVRLAKEDLIYAKSLFAAASKQ